MQPLVRCHLIARLVMLAKPKSGQRNSSPRSARCLVGNKLIFSLKPKDSQIPLAGQILAWPIRIIKQSYPKSKYIKDIRAV
jgi:hypothetical protein